MTPLSAIIPRRCIASLLLAASLVACAPLDLDKTGVDEETGHALYERVSDRMHDIDRQYVAAVAPLEPRIDELVDSWPEWLAPLATSEPVGNQRAADLLTKLIALIDRQQQAELDYVHATQETIHDLRIHERDRYSLAIWIRDHETPIVEVNGAWRMSLRRLMAAAKAVDVLGYKERQAGRAKVVRGALVLTPEAEAQMAPLRATLAQRTAEFAAAQLERSSLPPRFTQE